MFCVQSSKCSVCIAVCVLCAEQQAVCTEQQMSCAQQVCTSACMCRAAGAVCRTGGAHSRCSAVFTRHHLFISWDGESSRVPGPHGAQQCTLPTHWILSATPVCVVYSNAFPSGSSTIATICRWINVHAYTYIDMSIYTTYDIQCIYHIYISIYLYVINTYIDISIYEELFSKTR